MSPGRSRYAKLLYSGEIARLRIKKAVITAAGPHQRTLPLQLVIDRDGVEKSILCILIEQAHSANIEEVCIVVWPGDEERYEQAASRHAGSVRFVPQPEPLGYGNAIYCAREFTAGEPFLHLVGDHLYVNASRPSVQRLVELAATESCCVSGVQRTRESLLPRFGAVAGPAVSGKQGVYRVQTVLEKPTPTEAEQRLMVPGLGPGKYLCFFGVHVLTPDVMELLAHHRLLSHALGEVARREQVLAWEDDGRRYDLGARYGLLNAQLALAIQGQDRALVLSQLLELLADNELSRGAR